MEQENAIFLLALVKTSWHKRLCVCCLFLTHDLGVALLYFLVHVGNIYILVVLKRGYSSIDILIYSRTQVLRVLKCVIVRK